LFCTYVHLEHIMLSPLLSCFIHLIFLYLIVRNSITSFIDTRFFCGTTIIPCRIHVSCPGSGYSLSFTLNVRPLSNEAKGVLTCQAYCPALPMHHVDDSLPVAGGRCLGRIHTMLSAVCKVEELISDQDPLLTYIVISMRLWLIMIICLCRL
jgi:hypothetical protein